MTGNIPIAQTGLDEANERGYLGVTTDPTPDENYMVRGVGKGLPTPETDPEQAAKVRVYQDQLAEGEVTQ